MQGTSETHDKPARATASFGSGAGRDPAAARRAGLAVVRALCEAVWTPAPDSASGTPASPGGASSALASATTPAPPVGDARAADVLAARILPLLDTDHFFALQVTPRGFRVHRTLVADGAQDLAPRLAADGVAEILFKRGLTRAELDRCISILRTGTSVGHSVPTLLWEAQLEHVVCRCTDEIPGPDDGRFDLCGWGEAWPGGDEQLDLLAAVPPAIHALNLGDAGSGGVPGGATSQTAAGSDAGAAAAPRTDWRALVALAPEERAHLRGLELEAAGVAAVRLAHRLAVLHGVESDPERRSASLVVLGDLVDALFVQREFAVLQAVLEELQEGRTNDAATPETALEHVVQRLCSEAHVMTLGTMLEERGTWPEETVAIRSFLARLPAALDPLCRLLVRLEDMHARTLACRVLAAVAKDDPAALAQRAAGQPWYLARNVAYVLGRIANSRVLPALKRWVRHEDERVRIEVARALRRVRDPGAAPLLVEMLDDESWHVRQSAVWSLAELGDGCVVPRLRQILFEDRTFRTRRPEERDDFFRTYGRLVDGEAFRELVQVLDQKQIVAFGWQAELRRGAALALGETERPDAVRLLRAQQKARDPRLREAANEALRNMRARVAASLEEGDDRGKPVRALARSGSGTEFKLEFGMES